MEQAIIIQKTVEFVKETLKNAETAHDRWHIYRVWKTAKHIAKSENADLLVVELSALLHDIKDYKFHNWDEELWPKVAWIFLESIWIDESMILHVQNIIKNISFKWLNNVQEFKSLELDIVQDADRLDAIWAIGIARAFTTWAKFNEVIYNPDILVPVYDSWSDYVKAKWKEWRTVINHFYEKLLLLKDKMNTKTWKSMAQHRHNYMESYLEQFYKEWEWEL